MTENKDSLGIRREDMKNKFGSMSDNTPSSPSNQIQRKKMVDEMFPSGKYGGKISAKEINWKLRELRSKHSGTFDSKQKSALGDQINFLKKMSK